MNQLAAAVSKNDQIAGKISAVHGGNIFRVEWAQIESVVPIVEMAAEKLHPLHRSQSRFHTLHEIHSAQPTEIPRSNRGEQIKADIRWRGSVCDNRLGIFLKIVRRKPMVFGGNKTFKEVPRPARNQTQFLRFLR